MNIALIAHDKKKELMASFCIAYKGILEKHTLFTTETTGSIIIGACGLNIHKFSHGLLGVQQIEARAAYDELDLVIFLRDPATEVSRYDEPDMASLLKQCDINTIPFATNIASAELLITGLDRGDLDWRQNIKQS